jgi:hypothetical protein
MQEIDQRNKINELYLIGEVGKDYMTSDFISSSRKML